MQLLNHLSCRRDKLGNFRFGALPRIGNVGGFGLDNRLLALAVQYDGLGCDAKQHGDDVEDDQHLRSRCWGRILSRATLRSIAIRRMPRSLFFTGRGVRGRKGDVTKFNPTSLLLGRLRPYRQLDTSGGQIDRHAHR
jgi:hypothetical protein